MTETAVGDLRARLLEEYRRAREERDTEAERLRALDDERTREKAVRRVVSLLGGAYRPEEHGAPVVEGPSGEWGAREVTVSAGGLEFVVSFSSAGGDYDGIRSVLFVEPCATCGDPARRRVSSVWDIGEVLAGGDPAWPPYCATCDERAAEEVENVPADAIVNGCVDVVQVPRAALEGLRAVLVIAGALPALDNGGEL